ncbi:MAG TPA: threonine synthase [Actinomycetota bacterium]|nr:threonine synthase [Actinomycetota bacterium]
MSGPGVVARWRAHLPVSDSTPVVTLCEGDTPLLSSERLSDETGVRVWLKHEGHNPTGSFKDRGMAVAVPKALEDGARVVVCASTGNTSASAAAYAARAGVSCGVVVPAGGVARGKIAQTLVHGARAFEIDGTFDDALEVTRTLADRYPVALVNSVNPYRIEGQKTAAFEIVEALGRAPDAHFVPVGNAGNVTSHWRGYREAAGAGWSRTTPALYGVQAEGAAPIVRGHPVDAPQTIASAIRIGRPASWRNAVAAVDESGGAVVAVSDDEILDAYTALAREGVFVEPASAASVAGLRRLARVGRVARGATVVCVLTGHGLKDPDRAVATAPAMRAIAADADALAAALGVA